MNDFLNEMIEKTLNEKNVTFKRCNLNETHGNCDIDKLKNHTLVCVYNPAYKRTQIIKLKTSSKS
jgi:hypothetical protein